MPHDWAESDRRLYAAARRAVRAFVAEHPAEDVCALFFDCDEPRYGRVAFSLDTPANNRRVARNLEAHVVATREQLLRDDEHAWRSAKYALTSPPVGVFSVESGGFAFPQYRAVTFPTWRQLAKSRSKVLPPAGEERDEFLASHVRLVTWRVTERLIADDSLAPLATGRPVRDRVRPARPGVRDPAGPRPAGRGVNRPPAAAAAHLPK